eukprot:Opistho-2@9292
MTKLPGKRWPAIHTGLWKIKSAFDLRVPIWRRVLDGSAEGTRGLTAHAHPRGRASSPSPSSHSPNNDKDNNNDSALLDGDANTLRRRLLVALADLEVARAERDESRRQMQSYRDFIEAGYRALLDRHMPE